MTDAELMAAIDELRSTIISVATGGERIEQANQQYQQTYRDINFELVAEPAGPVMGMSTANCEPYSFDAPGSVFALYTRSNLVVEVTIVALIIA